MLLVLYMELTRYESYCYFMHINEMVRWPSPWTGHCGVWPWALWIIMSRYQMWCTDSSFTVSLLEMPGKKSKKFMNISFKDGLYFDVDTELWVIIKQPGHIKNCIYLIVKQYIYWWIYGVPPEEICKLNFVSCTTSLLDLDHF